MALWLKDLFAVVWVSGGVRGMDGGQIFWGEQKTFWVRFRVNKSSLVRISVHLILKGC